jgi:hypothetical protein
MRAGDGRLLSCGAKWTLGTVLGLRGDREGASALCRLSGMSNVENYATLRYAGYPACRTWKDRKDCGDCCIAFFEDCPEGTNRVMYEGGRGEWGPVDAYMVAVRMAPGLGPLSSRLGICG